MTALALAREADTGSGAVGPEAVALHAERTDDPATVRWHIAGGLGVADDADLRADPYLAQLLTAGVLAAVAADHGVVTTLADGHGWAGTGAAVRDAVQHAVMALRAGGPPVDRDAALATLAERVVHDDAGPYAASHGGGIELLGVRDDVVYIRMRGACDGCPAAGWTVQGQLERHLRTGAPWLVGVRITSRLPD